MHTEKIKSKPWIRIERHGLMSVGDLESQMYRIKNQLPSTKPTLKFA